MEPPVSYRDPHRVAGYFQDQEAMMPSTNSRGSKSPEAGTMANPCAPSAKIAGMTKLLLSGDQSVIDRWY